MGKQNFLWNGEAIDGENWNSQAAVCPAVARGRGDAVQWTIETSSLGVIVEGGVEGGNGLKPLAGKKRQRGKRTRENLTEH